MLAHTTSEAKRLGLGVDMATGTGWPNGGPRVTTEMASGSAVVKRFEAASFASAIPPRTASNPSAPLAQTARRLN